MVILKSSVGRKLIMSVTGIGMILFVVVHLLGNTTIYSGPDGINAYARALHRFPLLLWAFRLTLLAMATLHVYYGIVLTIENRTARPQAYAVGKNLSSTFAGRNMIWTGVLIGVFVVYHLLHFTFQVTNPEIAASLHPDLLGRPDVFMMVVSSFHKFLVSAAYIGAMVALGLHLGHSIQSSLQTIGMNNERTLPVVMRGGVLAALLIALGFAAFPVAVLAGLVR